MPLIHCPECNKEISDTAKICPNCGYGFEKKRGKFAISLICLGVIILIGFYVLVFLKPSEIRAVSLQISSIGDINANSEKAIFQAEQSYGHLNSLQKIFVTNYGNLRNDRAKFDALPINLTTDNINEYITFNISYSNYVDNSGSVFGIPFNNATATMIVNYYSLKDVIYENAQIAIHCKEEERDYGLGNWKEVDVIINISASGEGSVSTPLSYDSVMDIPVFPNLNQISIISVTGTAKHK